MLGAWRQHLDDQIGGTPYLVADDREPRRGDKQHVGLEDQRAFAIEDDVDRGHRHATEDPWLGVIGDQSRDFEGHGLVRKERCRRAGFSHGQGDYASRRFVLADCCKR